MAPVQADPTRLRLLLRNLLENALRHGAGAGKQPIVFVRREADQRLALGVRDFGQGVPADQLPLLAQAFYRPDSARTRSSGAAEARFARTREATASSCRTCPNRNSRRNDPSVDGAYVRSNSRPIPP